MRRHFALLPLLASLVLPACGPSAGDDCEGGGYVCSDETQALECRDGTWRALPCKGPLGCSDLDDSIRCDMSANTAGDACALSAEGRGLCTADGKALLECRMGVLVQVRECSACSTSSTRVICEP
jgi:hypothetical protein